MNDNDALIEKSASKENIEPEETRREFFIGLGKWSKIAICAAVLGESLALPSREAGAWNNGGASGRVQPGPTGNWTNNNRWHNMAPGHAPWSNQGKVSDQGTASIQTSEGTQSRHNFGQAPGYAEQSWDNRGQGQSQTPRQAPGFSQTSWANQGSTGDSLLGRPVADASPPPESCEQRYRELRAVVNKQKEVIDALKGELQKIKEAKDGKGH